MSEAFRSVKRPHEEGEVNSRMQYLRMEVEKLVTVMEKSSRTKGEINTLVQKLKRQVMDVKKEWVALDGEEEKIQKIKSTTTANEMRTVGTQVEARDTENEHKQKHKKIVSRIMSTVEGNGDFSSLAEVLDKKWPQEVYKVTEIDQKTQSTPIGTMRY